MKSSRTNGSASGQPTHNSFTQAPLPAKPAGSGAKTLTINTRQIMENQHTPGPYEIEEFFDRENVIPGDIVIVSRFGVVGAVFIRRGGKTVPMEEQEATARLWETAPELFEACQFIAKWLRSEELAPNKAEYLETIIAKATGQSTGKVLEVASTVELDQLRMENEVLTRELARVAMDNFNTGGDMHYMIQALNAIAVNAESGLGNAPERIDLIEIRDIARMALHKVLVAPKMQTAKIYGTEIEFEKVVPLGELDAVALDIWNDPDKYCGYKNGSAASYYEFLKFLWIQRPDGLETRLVDFVDAYNAIVPQEPDGPDSADYTEMQLDRDAADAPTPYDP